MKELSTADTLDARRLGGEVFNFAPTHKLWVRGNHLPGVRDNSDGFWRRMLMLRFEHKFEPQQIITEFDKTILAEEGSGVLNWALAGCLEWREMGLQIPASVKNEVNKYREDSDSGSGSANAAFKPQG
jgi:putative DNA primase/helicase